MRPMSYLEDDYLVTEKKYSVSGLLLPGENLVHIADISPGIYWKGIAMLIVALIALVYSPSLAIYFAMGERSKHILDDLKLWMSHNNTAIMAVLFLVIGAKLVGDSISTLAA